MDKAPQIAFAGKELAWVNVGLEKLDHTRWIDQCSLPGNVVEKLIHLKSWHRTRLGSLQRIAMYLLCRQYFIGIATLGVQTSVSPGFVVTQADQAAQPCYGPQLPEFHETQFETFVRCDILTRGFARPHSLADRADLFERSSEFEAMRCPVKEESQQHILVVGHELDRIRAFFVFTLAAVLTLAIGCGLGGAKHHIELGATIGAAVFGCLAIVQVAIVWTSE